MVFNMVVSSFSGITRLPVGIAGLVDHAGDVTCRALKPTLSAMIDIVHLDDIFVMFPSGTARMRSAKVPQINIIAGMFGAIGVQINGLRCTIVPMEIRRDA